MPRRADSAAVTPPSRWQSALGRQGRRRWIDGSQHLAPYLICLSDLPLCRKAGKPPCKTLGRLLCSALLICSSPCREIANKRIGSSPLDMLRVERGVKRASAFQDYAPWKQFQFVRNLADKQLWWMPSSLHVAVEHDPSSGPRASFRSGNNLILGRSWVQCEPLRTLRPSPWEGWP